MNAPGDLHQLLDLLTSAGELHPIRAAVEPRLEIAAVVDRICKEPGGGPALCFEKPAGFAVPVLANLFGSPRRVALALGISTLHELGAKLGAALASAGPGCGAERLERFFAAQAWQPRLVANGPCREVRGGADLLEDLPALQSWPGDGGRYLTLPLVFTRHPESGAGNCGMYRLQLFADGTLGLHLGPHADARRHLAAWQERGEAMPVAVALGGPPALLFAAGLPLPPAVAETAFAGWLQGRPLEMVAAADPGLAVPAAAECVIEGVVRPGELRLEGPFGNHTGHYVPAAPAPLLRVARVSRRSQALYPCTVVGPPPMEDCWLAKAGERLLLPLLQLDCPEVVDWNLPLATIFHGAALVAARVPAGGGRALLQRLRQHPLLARARLLVLFDQGVDVQQPAACYWQALNRVAPEEGIRARDGLLDIDASDSTLAPVVGADAGTAGRIAERWREFGFSTPA